MLLSSERMNAKLKFMVEMAVLLPVYVPEYISPLKKNTKKHTLKISDSLIISSFLHAIVCAVLEWFVDIIFFLNNSLPSLCVMPLRCWYSN